MGIEPNSKMATYGRENRARHQDNKGEDFSDSSGFDLVSMIQVIPHFVDIRKALESIAELTRSGGYWLIETWDRYGLVAKL